MGDSMKKLMLISILILLCSCRIIQKEEATQNIPKNSLLSKINIGDSPEDVYKILGRRDSEKFIYEDDNGIYKVVYYFDNLGEIAFEQIERNSSIIIVTSIEV